MEIMRSDVTSQMHGAGSIATIFLELTASISLSDQVE